MGILFSIKQKNICILLLLYVAQKSFSQPVKYFHFVDPYTINVSGNYKVIQHQIFDWSIGELSTRTLNARPLIIFSLGFLQSNYDPLLQYKHIDSFALQIKIGPNPFSDYIIIQSKQDQVIINSIQLIDFQGNILYQLNGDYSGHDFYFKMPIKKLMNPLCFLNIRYTISGQIYKSKFFKLLQN
jgi:hypothetical protein